MDSESVYIFPSAFHGAQKCSVFSAFFSNVAILHLLVSCTCITFIWFVQHLKSSLVNLFISRERKAVWESQDRIACAIRTHTNTEAHNIKTIEQRMQNIQQLIPYKLSSVVACKVRVWTNTQRDASTRQNFCIVYKRWTFTIHMRQNTTNKYRNCCNNSSNGPNIKNRTNRDAVIRSVHNYTHSHRGRKWIYCLAVVRASI